MSYTPEFQGFQAYNLPHAMASELKSFMRSYIIRWLLWCLGVVVGIHYSYHDDEPELL